MSEITPRPSDSNQHAPSQPWADPTTTEQMVYDTGYRLARSMVEKIGLSDVNKRLEEENGKLSKLALENAVTGLPNRAAFMQDFEQRVAGGEELAIAFMDIDHLKTVNDNYGHKTGDDVLRGVGKVSSEVINGAGGQLEAQVREGDTVYHLSGDEYAFIFGAEQRSGEKLSTDERLEAIRTHLVETVDQYARLCLPPEWNVGASVGIVVHRPGDSLKDTLAAADAEMYRYKAERHAATGTTPR